MALDTGEEIACRQLVTADARRQVVGDLVLKALEAGEKREGKAAGSSPFVYVSAGRVFRLDGDGRLVSKASDLAAPVSWPLAHDVRPLQQSLGWNGCAPTWMS